MKLEKVLANFAQSFDEHYGQQRKAIEVILPTEIYDEFHNENMKEEVYRSPIPRPDAPVPLVYQLVPLVYQFRTSMGNRIYIRRQE